MTRPTLLLDNSPTSRAVHLVASVANSECHIPPPSTTSHPPLPRIHASHGDITTLPLILLHLTSSTPLHISSPQQSTELDTWIQLFQSVTSTSLTPNVLQYLNDSLASRTYLLSTHMTAADLLMLCAVYDTVKGWKEKERSQWVHLMRWFDFIQHHQKLLPIIEYIPPASPLFTLDIYPPPPPPTKPAAASPVPPKPSLVSSLTSAVSTAASSAASSAASAASAAVKAASPSQPPSGTSSPPPITRLDLRVATVLTASPHPTEPRLAVLTVDVGEAQPRQLVAGIAEFTTLNTLIGQLVLCMCNLKAGDIKGVESNGRILVATAEGEGGKEGKKEICFVEGEKVRGGEKVRVVEGVEPDAVLAPKNLHRILKGLKTDEAGCVKFEEFHITTSAGKVQTSIKNGTVA